MDIYTASVVLENVELTDKVLGDLFTTIDDVVPSSIDGVVKVTAPIEASDDVLAAFQLVDQVQAAIPGAVPVRLDQDLVSISDIAERTGRTRESVRFLVDGKRGPGGFPAPVGSVGDAIRVWPWAAVADWFRTSLDEDLGERGVSPEAAAVVDACLAGKLPPRVLGTLRAPIDPPLTSQQPAKRTKAAKKAAAATGKRPAPRTKAT